MQNKVLALSRQINYSIINPGFDTTILSPQQQSLVLKENQKNAYFIRLSEKITDYHKLADELNSFNKRDNYLRARDKYSLLEEKITQAIAADQLSPWNTFQSLKTTLFEDLNSLHTKNISRKGLIILKLLGAISSHPKAIGTWENQHLSILNALTELLFHEKCQIIGLSFTKRYWGFKGISTLSAEHLTKIIRIFCSNTTQHEDYAPNTLLLTKVAEWLTQKMNEASAPPVWKELPRIERKHFGIKSIMLSPQTTLFKKKHYLNTILGDALLTCFIKLASTEHISKNNALRAFPSTVQEVIYGDIRMQRLLQELEENDEALLAKTYANIKQYGLTTDILSTIYQLHQDNRFYDGYINKNHHYCYLQMSAPIPKLEQFLTVYAHLTKDQQDLTPQLFEESAAIELIKYFKKVCYINTNRSTNTAMEPLHKNLLVFEQKQIPGALKEAKEYILKILTPYSKKELANGLIDKPQRTDILVKTFWLALSTSVPAKDSPLTKNLGNSVARNAQKQVEGQIQDKIKKAITETFPALQPATAAQAQNTTPTTKSLMDIVIEQTPVLISELGIDIAKIIASHIFKKVFAHYIEKYTFKRDPYLWCTHVVFLSTYKTRTVLSDKQISNRSKKILHWLRADTKRSSADQLRAYHDSIATLKEVSLKSWGDTLQAKNTHAILTEMEKILTQEKK